MRWWVNDEGGHFSVTDTGMGVPPEHIPPDRAFLSSGRRAFALNGRLRSGPRHRQALCCSATERSLRFKAHSVGQRVHLSFPLSRVQLARVPQAAESLSLRVTRKPLLR